MVVKIDWSLFQVHVVDAQPDLPPLKDFFLIWKPYGIHDIICTILLPVKI